jgi:hypothetical protein
MGSHLSIAVASDFHRSAARLSPRSQTRSENRACSPPSPRGSPPDDDPLLERDGAIMPDTEGAGISSNRISYKRGNRYEEPALANRALAI